MKRKDKEITEMHDIEEILDQALIMRIAMVHGNEPYLVPVNFAYRDKTIYLHSASEGMKIDILRTNPQVCFEVTVDEELVRSEKPCGFGMRYRSVIGTGNAWFIEEPDTKRQALGMIAEKYAGSSEGIPESEMKGVAVIRIDIVSLNGKKSGY